MARALYPLLEATRGATCPLARLQNLGHSRDPSLDTLNVSTHRIIPAEPAEVVVHDEVSPCPYLRERLARMPLRLPVRSLSHDELDARLKKGDRRQGFFLYTTACPSCRACEPIRLDVSKFSPGRTQRRVFARANSRLRTELGPPIVDDRRVELYNKHRVARGLDDGHERIDHEGYRAFLVHTCCDSLELRYFQGDELVAVAIVDRGAESLSAVYTFYDPAIEPLSPGVFSILKQIELCKTWDLEYLYLGLYIADCPPMAYKARYVPHERFYEGEWIPGGPR